MTASAFCKCNCPHVAANDTNQIFQRSTIIVGSGQFCLYVYREKKYPCYNDDTSNERSFPKFSKTQAVLNFNSSVQMTEHSIFFKLGSMYTRYLSRFFDS